MLSRRLASHCRCDGLVPLGNRPSLCPSCGANRSWLCGRHSPSRGLQRPQTGRSRHDRQLIPQHSASRHSRLRAASLTRWSSASSLHAILMRSLFLESLTTAAQRQLTWPSVLRISSSIASLIIPGCALSLSSSPTLDVSTVQYGVSVIVDGVVRVEERRVRTLLGLLLGVVRATSAYDGEGLGACMLAT